MSYRLIAAAVAAIALQGCATKAPVAPAPTEDVNLGISKTCSFTPVEAAPGGSASSTIAMTNDGWCAVRLTERDGQPFQLGLLRQRPEHGHVLIQKMGGQTRLEYTANPGYAGADRFSAALRSRDATAPDTMMQVAVNVSMGEGTAVSPAPAPAPEKKAAPTRHRARTPARRTN
ncbi:MAG: hypothetical protein NVSMB18_11460 [Acetobacteraceae bacterium]